jgi:hypothetical protein
LVRRLAAVAVLLLTACGNQADTPAPSPSATPTIVPLTVAQATKAALTVADLPKGWEGGVAPDPTPTLSTPVKYSPANCWIVRDALRDSGAPTTAIRGQYFTRKNDNSQSVTEFVYSWPKSQLPLLHRIAGTLPQCGTVTGTWYEGESYRISVRQMAVPGLKNGIALRIGDPDDPKATSVGYSAYVARGGTLVRLNTDSAVFTDATFSEFLTKAVARLDAVD